MNAPKPDTPTKQEHDAWVAANGRPYTQRPRGRRRPKEITDMPATGFSIVDGAQPDEITLPEGSV